jgi:hypothetical protein
MRFLVGSIALAALVCATTAASAQFSPQQSQMNRNADIGRHAADANSRGSSDDSKARANDKAYNSVLRNIPDKQFDPWRGVR